MTSNPTLNRRTMRTEGMTLIEMLVYVAILGVILNVCLVLFINSTRLSLIGMQGLERFNGTERIRAEFTETVRRSDSVVAAVGAYRTSEEVVIVRLSKNHSDDAKTQYAVWGRIGKEDAFARLVLSEEENNLSIERFTPYALEMDGISFAYDQTPVEKARLVTLTISPTAPKKNTKSYIIRAAPRGAP